MAKKTFVSSISAVCDNATSFLLQYKAIPANALVCYDRIVAMNATSASSFVEVGLRHSDKDYILEKQANVAAKTSVEVDNKIFAPGHYKPYCKVFGGSAGDLICLYIFGYYVDDTTTES